MTRGARFEGVPATPKPATIAAERQQAHQVAIDAYNKAQAALNDAANLVTYLTDEVRRTFEVCQSFMPPTTTPTTTQKDTQS